MTVAAQVSPAAVAFKAFLKLAKRWSLDEETQAILLGIPDQPQELRNWALHPERVHINRDTLERISHLLHIYDDLAALFGRGEAADSWIVQNNRDFANLPPLERLRAGNVDDIISVRRYLDCARQGW